MKVANSHHHHLVQLIVICVLLPATPTPTQPRHPLILILLDGFRWDYTTIHKGPEGLPGFNQLTAAGARASYTSPVFPSNSFPNWHTIVTGLYPESHGIVSNYMLDWDRGAEFSLSRMETTGDPEWWRSAEPLWITATKQNLSVALFQWSRCDVEWEGILPRFCEPYVKDDTGSTANFFTRLNQALDMIQKENYDLVMVYEGAADTRGHIYGPMSPNVAAAVHETDKALQILWQNLEKRAILNTTNVVVTSDHGMSGLIPEQVELASCLASHQVEAVIEQGGYTNISPSPGYTDQVLEAIKTCPGAVDRVDVYVKEVIPWRYHYRASRLIHQVIVIAKPGYSIRIAGNLSTEAPDSMVGNHGFDDTLGHNPDMRGILYTQGPAFARGVAAGKVDQVDVYGLLCRALTIPARPNNGSHANIEAFFREEQEQDEEEEEHLSFASFCLMVFIFLVSVFSVV